MKSFRRSLVAGLFGMVGKFPTKITPREELVGLLRSLHPVTTPRPLIRMGPPGDGGYLVPDDLAGLDACFSPGVSSVSGFERECAERGMQVFMADRSVDGPAEEHANFHFIKKYIGATRDDGFVTLDDWVAASIPSTDSELLLQIDIEGFEYEVFLAASDALMKRLRIIVVEFHDLEQLWSRPFFNIARRAFDKIAQTHRCVHLHPNNCCGSTRKGGLGIPRVMEFSFLRHDRLGEPGYMSKFPHPLDADNTPNRPMVLPRHWYRSA